MTDMRAVAFSPRRRWAVLVLGLALLAGLGWLWWGRTPPVPPIVDLDGADPQVAAAIRQAREEVCRTPRAAPAWGRLGRLLLTHEYVEPALACLAEADRLDGADPRWPYLRGLALFRSDTTASLEHLRRAADLAERHDPKSLAARLRLAEVYLTLRMTAEAEEQLDRAARKGPSNKRLRFNRGVLACARGDAKASRALLAPFAGHPAVRRRACALLAVLCRQLGEAEQAAGYARAAAQGPPDMGWQDPYAGGEARLLVGRESDFEAVAALEQERDVAGAIARLQKMAAAGDADGLVHFALGVTLGRAGRYAEAEQALRTAASRCPDRFRALYALSGVQRDHAEALARDGNADQARARRVEAVATAREAVAVKPNDGLAQLHLGQCLLALGRSAEAIPPLRRAAACRPEEAATHRTLGQALLAQGELAEALRSLERAALLAGPADREVADALAALRAAQRARK